MMSIKFYNDRPWQQNLRQKSPTSRLVLHTGICLRLTGASRGQAIQRCQ